MTTDPLLHVPDKRDEANLELMEAQLRERLERAMRMTAAERLLTDIVQKATPYGTQDGDFIASYLLPTGPIHRAIAYCKERGIPTVADVEVPNV